jgi:hypothetical protein
MPRFVILFHEMPPASDRTSHWDFMLQGDEALKTWALSLEPDSAEEQSCEQLPDHRLAYLDYEGPVSGDRGHVTRWDAGTYQAIKECDRAFEVELTGRRLTCRVELKQSNDPQLWRFRIVRKLTRSTSDFSR